MPILVNSDDATRPSSQQLGDYLSSLGASYGERLMLTGAATSESGRDPGAKHDYDANGNPIGFGMFGHNGSRLMAMRQYAGANGQDIGDWRTQAAFALNELRGRPEGKAAANATTPEQAALAQMYYERPAGFSEQNPEAGRNYVGRLDTIRSLASGNKNAPASFAPETAATNGTQFPTGMVSGSGSSVGLAGYSAGGMPVASPFGNPQLNAAMARALAGPSSDGYQPLVGYLINKGANTLIGSLSSLLGGAGQSPSASAQPSRPAPPMSSPSAGAAPATAAPASVQAPQQPPSLPFFADGGPPKGSPIIQPQIGQASQVPTMTGGFGAGLASLFGGMPQA